MINVAIMGHGVVGSGVAEILINHSQRVGKAAHNDINVKYILDLRDFDVPYSDKFVKDFNIILNDPDVKIVAELMGGTNPAYSFVKSCLEAKKSVVTSNKELVAAKGAELLKIAEENGVNFLFEASVGGGIPVLRPMAQCLVANEITEVAGILNGTTNYILNKMIVDNMDFDSALALAQKKGYAEKNPAADIEGYDACRKISILAALAFGKHVYPEQVETTGITGITLDDVDAAESFGCVIKLIGRATRLANGKISATVRPAMVFKSSVLSGVNGVFNAIMVTGDETGDVMFYGKGAGKNATASAVVADIIDCSKHIQTRKYVFWEEGYLDYVDNITEVPEKFFVRVSSDDYQALEKRFEELFPSVQSVKNKYSGEISFMTEPMLKSQLDEALSKLDNIKSLKLLHTYGG